MEIRAAALSRGCFACRQSSPLREAHGRNMIAEAACGRSSLSEKAGCAGLFRQDTFPLRLGARPGKRAGKPCCARLPNPPRMSPGSDCIWRASALQASQWVFRRSAATDGTGRGLPPLPASPQKCDMLNLAAQGFGTRRACRRVRIVFGGLRPSKPPQTPSRFGRRPKPPPTFRRPASPAAPEARPAPIQARPSRWPCRGNNTPGRVH